MAATNNSLDIPQGDGQILIGMSGVAPVATHITGSGSITVTNGPGTIDISSTSSGFPWTPVVAMDTVMSPNNGYSVSNVGTLNFTIPVKGTYSLGDVFKVATWSNIGTFSILASPNQTISFNGNTGSVSLTAPLVYGASIELVCVSISTTDRFVVTNYVGSLTLL